MDDIELFKVTEIADGQGGEVIEIECAGTDTFQRLQDSLDSVRTGRLHGTYILSMDKITAEYLCKALAKHFAGE